MYQFDLPKDSLMTGDKAYVKCDLEDIMMEANLNLLHLQKKSFQWPFLSWMTYLLFYHRKVVKATERLLPIHIYAATARGFKLKVTFFVLAVSRYYSRYPLM